MFAPILVKYFLHMFQMILRIIFGEKKYLGNFFSQLLFMMGGLRSAKLPGSWGQCPPHTPQILNPQTNWLSGIAG